MADNEERTGEEHLAEKETESANYDNRNGRGLGSIIALTIGLLILLYILWVLIFGISATSVDSNVPTHDSVNSKAPEN